LGIIVESAGAVVSAGAAVVAAGAGSVWAIVGAADMIAIAIAPALLSANVRYFMGISFRIFV
jgi:hypothetical protein